MADGGVLPWNTGVTSDLTHNSKHRSVLPAEAIRQHHSGVVVVVVLIGTSGEVKDVKVERSSGFYGLDHAAIDAVKEWKFGPAFKSGVTTEGYGRMPLTF